MHDDDYCLESVATFDRAAARYAGKYFDLDIYDGYLERFAERIEPHGARVLDAACGPGNVAACLIRLRPDLGVTGIDLAEGMIRQARARVPSAEFLVQDCRRIDMPGQAFDAAVFAFGLNYLNDADAERFFASLNASLAPSAMLYLSAMTGDASWSGFETSSSGDRVYLQYRSVNDVIALVEKAGYSIDFTEVIASPANAPKATQDLVLIAQREGGETWGRENT